MLVNLEGQTRFLLEYRAVWKNVGVAAVSPAILNLGTDQVSAV
jgi:hypothetical protein